MSNGSDMTEGWYIRGGEGAEAWQTGPYTWEQLHSFIPESRLLPDNLVWHPSMTDWIPAREIPGLFPAAAADDAPPVTAAAHTPEAASPRSRSIGMAIAGIAVVVLLLIGGGIGAWAILGTGGFGGDDGPGMGTAETRLPDSSALVETAEWGEVPVNQLGVVLTEDGRAKDAERLADELGGSIVGELSFLDLYQIEFPGTSEADLTAALEVAQGADGIELAFPNEPLDLDTEIWGVRIDPYEDPAYKDGAGDGYKAIGLTEAWEYVKGSGLDLGKVHVGICDDGLYKGGGSGNEFNGSVEIDFPDDSAGELGAALVEDGTPDPTGSHGTSVATIIGADADNGGASGVAAPLGKNLKVSMTNIFSNNYGTTTTTPDPEDATKIVWGNGHSYSIGALVALTKQVERGATVINCSWGKTNGSPEMAAAFKKFFEKMAQDHPDVLFVCSGGNNGQQIDGSTRWPSGLSLPNMVTVGAIDNDGKTASYASKASENYEITLAAPGTAAVCGVDADGKPIRQDGSSFAAPHVAGAAAMLKAINPKLTAGQIKDILTATARQGVTIGAPDDPAAISNPIGAEVGGRVLAVDLAVLKVINDVRAEKGLAPLTEKQLKERGVVDAVAITQAPGEYIVRGIITGTDDGGTGITIDIRAEDAVLGGDAEQRLDGPGEVEWGVALPKDEGTIKITRTDNEAGSLITIEPLDINGTWSGTFTFTDFEITDQEAAEEEGCSAFIAQQLMGKPLPMTIQITVDEMGQGTATMNIDASALGEDAESSPQTFSVRQKGSAVTFEPTSGEGMGTMNATVNKEGSALAMKGTTVASGSGWKMTASFSAGKPIE